MTKDLEKLNKLFNTNDEVIHDELSEVIFEEERNDALLFYFSSLKDETAPLEEVIKDLAIRLTKFTFRNGPIERMHAGNYLIEKFENIPPSTPLEKISQLTDEDMKILNTFMVDRIGYLLTLFANGEYTKLRYLLSSPFLSAYSWDNPNIDKIEKEFFE